MTLNRRQFTFALAAGGAASALAQTAPPWAALKIVDCHHHLRRTPEANATHLAGAGISNCMALARDNSAEAVKEFRAAKPGKLLGWFAGTDVTKPEVVDLLRAAVKAGAIGFGELKSHVEAAGPELRRVYALAAELSVPVLVHFQEVPHTPTEGVFATGFKQFEAILKAYPKTKFIGHADAFWANVSADYANDIDYPPGPVKRGGVTDKLLSDYPNLFADISANSGNNALSRDPEFTAGFLKRHQAKLIFGSDCACSDGMGGGVSQGGNPGASRMAGKCVARETLGLLHRGLSAAAFKQITWENAHRVYRLSV